MLSGERKPWGGGGCALEVHRAIECVMRFAASSFTCVLDLMDVVLHMWTYHAAVPTFRHVSAQPRYLVGPLSPTPISKKKKLTHLIRPTFRPLPPTRT